MGFVVCNTRKHDTDKEKEIKQIAHRCPVCKGYCQVGYPPDRKPCHGCDAKGYILIPVDHKAIKCPACNGHGSKTNNDTCPACNGHGWVVVDKNVEPV